MNLNHFFSQLKIRKILSGRADVLLAVLLMMALVFTAVFIFNLSNIKIVFSGGNGGGGNGGGVGGPSGCPGTPSDTVGSSEASTNNGDNSGTGVGDAGGGNGGNGGNGGVSLPPSPTVTLTTWPTFELPEPIHLKWTSTNADSCVASGDWSGNKPTSGDEYLSKPRGTYTFILTCTGPGGSASDTATTKVIQVPRCTFTANPTSIILPQSSTLSWSCQYADTCSIDQGIGSVNNVSGTKQVRPPQTTTYTLSCSGLDGSRSYPATVNVGFVPWIKEVIPR